MIDISVDLAGLRLATPLIGASGVFGYGAEYGDLVDLRAFGALVAKTVTARPRAGNPPPRIVDAGCGLVNSIGLENVGCRSFAAGKLPGLKLPCRLFASIGGDSVDEYRAAAAALKSAGGIDALEVNVSCPNVAKGGIAFGSRPDSAAEVISAVVAETVLPVAAKLPPLTVGIEQVARAAQDAGARALTIANTYPAIAIDVETERPALGGVTGGYSGRAVKPMSLLLVWKVAGAVDIPVVGSGGVETAEDVVEYLLAGATAVEVGSAILRDLGAPAAMIAGLKDFMARKGYEKLGDFRGKARKAQPTLRSEEV